MKPDLAKLRARLAALRAKTTANGCTEAEAIAAAEKAAELMSGYGVTEADLDAPVFDELAVQLGARRSPLDGVWPTVARFADCRGYLERKGPRWAFVYFGREADVLVAEYVHEIVKRAAETAVANFRLSDAYTARRKPKTRARALKAFLEGFAVSICRKLASGLWHRYAAKAQEPDNAGALIEANLATVNAALALRGVTLSTARPITKAKGQFRDDARLKGHRAGSALSIEAGVADGSVKPVTGLLS